MQRYGVFLTCPECLEETHSDQWIIDGGSSECPQCGEVFTKKDKRKIKARREPRIRLIEKPKEDSED